MVRSGLWPEWMQHRQAIERAFRRSLPEDFGHSDAAKEDFHGLLVNIFWFTRLEELFQNFDTNDDEQLDLREFSRGLSQLGLVLSSQEANEEFMLLDRDRSGIADFGDFCLHVRRRVCPDDNPAFDEDQAADWRHCECLRRRHGAPALLRAHKAAACREEGLVHRPEFKRMLACLFYFNKLFWLYDESSDQGGERQLDSVEFRWCLVICGVRTSARRAETEFNSLVAASSAQPGHISFDEFCRHFSVKQCPQGFTDLQPTG